MNTTPHLTEDQLDDLLIAGLLDLPETAQLHFAACDDCQARAAAVESPLASFREVSLAWAERQSATLPVPQATTAGRRTHHRLAWASVVTAVVAVGVAIPMAHERADADSTATPQPSVAVVGHTGIANITPAAATPEQIERDNQMLQEIDRAMDAPADTPAEYGLVPATGRAAARVRANTMRD